MDIYMDGRKHLTHGYYMWLIGHVKDYQNTQVKKEHI